MSSPIQSNDLGVNPYVQEQAVQHSHSGGKGGKPVGMSPTGAPGVVEQEAEASTAQATTAASVYEKIPGEEEDSKETSATRDRKLQKPIDASVQKTKKTGDKSERRFKHRNKNQELRI